MLQWIFAWLIFPFTLSAQAKRFRFTETKMGSPFQIILYHEDSTTAAGIAKNCFTLVDSLNNIYSNYSPSSEISRLAEKAFEKPQKVSDELFSMLLTCKHAWIKSGKTFDVTIGPLTELWRKARNEKKFPSKKEIKKVKRLTGFDKLEIDTFNKTVFFRKKGMRLDFGGIVKGYAAQYVMNYLKSLNINPAMVDAGGDIVTGEPPPGKNGWIIGINLPEQHEELWKGQLELSNSSVATSGDVYQYFYYRGKKYSHIINPRTGYGVISHRNVTVIDKNGTASDWLATACSILPVEKALKLIKKENAALMVAIRDGDKIIIRKSWNFDDYLQKKEP